MIRMVSTMFLTGLLMLGAGTTSVMAQAAQPSTVFPGEDAFQRGWKLDQEIGAPINIPEAIKAYREAAAAGNPLAKARLARIYFGGNGVVVDKGQAEQLAKGIFPDLLKAAEQNDSIAQMAVGTMYVDGLGVARDGAEGLNWVRKAAAQNLPLAQANLGVMYEHGEGVPMDIAQAAAWFNTAALQNNAMGQAYLADLYNEGRGLPQNRYEAARLYGLSAAQNFAYAETNLGYMYEHGCAVTFDPVEAVRLYRLAAQKNFAIAETNLGTMYENGCGVAQDLNAAVYWYGQAAVQGDANAIAALRCLGYQA
jgi:TPR repeat protein